MNDPDRDPRRLLDADDTPPVLRDALAAARARAPSAAILAQLAARLPSSGAPGGNGPSGGPAPTTTSPVASGSTLSGALIGAAIGLGVVGASFVWQAAHEAPTLPRESVTTTAIAPLASSSSITAPIPTPRARAAASPTTRPIERPSNASAAPETKENDEAAPPLAEAPEALSAAPAPMPVDAESEAHFLDRARAALGASPAQALALTDEHAHRFPSGALGQEREVVAIQALLRLGRADEARARAQRFLAAFPGSVHRRRIEALVAP